MQIEFQQIKIKYSINYMYAGHHLGFDIYVAKKYPKKYYAIVEGKKIYFGDKRYGQFYDKMGFYRDLNHFNKVRRASYKKRHEKDRHIKYTPGWFSDKLLW